MRERECEFVGQRRSDSTYSVRDFAKISRSKGPILKQIKEKRVYVTSHRFHGIERERIPIALVGMQNAQ